MRPAALWSQGEPHWDGSTSKPHRLNKEILMTQTVIDPGADIRPLKRASRLRPRIALTAAAVVFTVGLSGILPFIFVLPVIGVGCPDAGLREN